MIPELLGRIRHYLLMRESGEARSRKHSLTEPKNALVKQYRRMFWSLRR